MKYLVTIFIMAYSFTISGQTIIGKWQTFDDTSKEKKGVVEIYQSNNLYFAKIVESFDEGKSGFCDTCQGSKKGQPIIGLIIIENIAKDGDEYSGGSILDPDNGETYSCYLELQSPNKLKVRGYLGFSFFGRTQYWIRKE